MSYSYYFWFCKVFCFGVNLRTKTKLLFLFVSGNCLYASIFRNCYLHAFLICNTFISHIRLKLATKTNYKEHHEAKILTLLNHLHFPSTLSTKNNRTYNRKYAKKKVCLFLRDYMVNHNENENEK